ncbi:MAG: hypothetical protein ISS41_07315 [Candidatus Aminicenantes bacterium]|nr:hypothetical protein [Candidatus Aminicenantes bacterium]
MADDRITYTVIIDFTQNDAGDEHYAELKAEVKSRLSNLHESKGTAQAHFVSIAEA